MPGIGKPCKIPRCSGWKYLRHRPFISGRLLRVVKKEIPAHILPVPAARLFRPLMFLRSMVHDKIHTDMDTPFPAGSRQTFQILHGTQVFLHFTEIRYRVSSVRTSFGRIEKGHQVDIVYITPANVFQLRFHALHVPRKIVNVEHHSEHIVPSVPTAVLLPSGIVFLQPRLPLRVKLPHMVAQFGKHGIIPV